MIKHPWFRSLSMRIFAAGAPFFASQLLVPPAHQVLAEEVQPASAMNPMNSAAAGQESSANPPVEKPMPPAPNSPVMMVDEVAPPAVPKEPASSPMPSSPKADETSEKASDAKQPTKQPEPKPKSADQPAEPKKSDPAKQPAPSKPAPSKPAPPKPAPTKPAAPPKPVDKPFLSPTGVDLKKGAIRVEDAGPDFALQGEYMAWDWSAEKGWHWLGIQVVATGDGTFDAIAYPGGLPGNGVTSRATMPIGTPQIKADSELLPTLWQGSGKATPEGLLITFNQPSEGRKFVTKDGQTGQLFKGDGALISHAIKWSRKSQREGARPPANAVILFDGTDNGQLKNLKVSPEGLMQIGSETKGAWQNFHLHAEFKTPFMPFAKGQARANSGFYLQKRYEVQVLDSFGLIPQFNDAAAIYRNKMPDLNMSFPPLSWQTYDIQFQAPLFDAQGTKIQNGRLTVWHNGIVVQNHVSLENKTGGGSKEGPEALPILFQNHGNPVEFRNLWLVELAPQVLQVTATQPSPASPTAVATPYACVSTTPCCPPKKLRRSAHCRR